MPQSARHAIVAALGGVAIASAAAGWGLWLSWGATGRPGLYAWALGQDETVALFSCLWVMILGAMLPGLARGAPGDPRPEDAQTPAPRPGWARRVVELRVQIGLAVILLAAILPYAFRASEWSWFIALRRRTPPEVWLALVSLVPVAVGVRRIRDARRGPSAPAAGT